MCEKYCSPHSPAPEIERSEKPVDTFHTPLLECIDNASSLGVDR
jgi:hypothetical protein